MFTCKQKRQTKTNVNDNKMKSDLYTQQLYSKIYMLRVYLYLYTIHNKYYFE